MTSIGASLGSYDANFAAAWDMLGSKLRDWLRTCGLWDPAGDRRRKHALLLGLIAAPLGLVLTAVGGIAAVPAGWGWPVSVVPGAVVAAIGLALAIRAWKLRIRTPHGSALWREVESFRQFLAESGAAQADEASTGGRIGQYTAWAVALGVVDRWTQAVAASTAPTVSPAPAHMYGPWTASSLSAAASASSTVPSSSGGGSVDGGGGLTGGDGFTGGGESGGGAGGGGGGSW